jgi:hypothetical protein
MPAYQGVSSRSSSQRKSGLGGSSSQTGVPTAPARCATALSTVTTRSSWRSMAALSVQSFHSAVRSTSAPGCGAMSV